MLPREKLLKTAQSYIGTKEPNGDDQFIKWFNSKTGSHVGLNQPWCCIFATFVFDKAGLGKLCKPFASCTALMNSFKKEGRWQERGYKPLPGDLCLYDWDKSGDADHIGIVESIKGDTITVIEGNKNDAVGRRTVAYSSGNIRGFAITKVPSGDVNGDGKVNASDALAVLKAAVKKIKLTDKQKVQADVNLDGKVDSADAKAILKDSVKK